MSSSYKAIIFDICGVLFEYPSMSIMAQSDGNIFHPLKSGISLLTALYMKTKEAGNQRLRFIACTNMSERKKNQLLSEHPEIMKLFEGIITSAQAGYPKPDPRIFKFLCDAYDLSFKDCIFIDDNQEFVQAASALGMAGIWFSDIDHVTDELEKFGAYSK